MGRFIGFELVRSDSGDQSGGSQSVPIGSVVVQKKHGTAIYQSGQEQVFELTVGGPYQATGGMGDTLAGMIVAAFCRTVQVKQSL